MKKVIIFLAIIIALFAAIVFVNQAQQKEKSAENPYEKASLHPATIDQLDDPNYQNLILPDELEEKLKNKEDVTVYFYSPTCPHCVATTPVVGPLAIDKGIDLVQFNLLEFEDGWNNYNIDSTPTIVQFKDGKEVARIVGSNEVEVFEQWFNENTK